MIPHFPEFKLLTLEDKDEVLAVCHLYAPYSDFNFNSLWSWNVQNNLEVSLFDEGLVIKAPDYISSEMTLSLLGEKNCYEKVLAVLDYAKSQQLKPLIKLVPGLVIDNISDDQRDKLIILEDRDNYDYILDAKEIAEFKGSKYYDKRNLVNRFCRLYPEHVVESLDLTDVATQTQVMQVFESWASAPGRDPDDSNNERTAVQRLLRYATELEVHGLGVFVDSELIAFATYEKDEYFGFISYEKAIKDFDGIYAYMNHLTAKKLLDMGCIYINFEQDLGIPGLRKAKELWRPIAFLRKYTIQEKS